ncbi:hypothetical protein Tco_0726765 [Tanacetum coccineum]|uniref:Extensin n=1 Tax=Tanacetum coccineum TaxID=301880 RepID=A0ABQ4YGI1_9ASTR
MVARQRTSSSQDKAYNPSSRLWVSDEEPDAPKEAPPSSYYVPGPEHPPSPDYVPSPEYPPSPVYVPKST